MMTMLSRFLRLVLNTLNIKDEVIKKKGMIYMKSKFKIKGIDCANCAAKLESTIQKIEGVEGASISFMTERLVIECKEEEKQEVM